MGCVPVGFRFEPRDEELVGFYLYNKVCGNPLSCNGVIMECDLYGDKEPWEIWEAFGGTTELYFFTRLKKTSAKSSRFRRTVGKGCWKGDKSGSYAKEVIRRITKERIGTVNTYRYKSKDKGSSEENNNRWIMYEFCLDGSLLPQSNSNDYVLCRITKKTVNTEEHDDYELIGNDLQSHESPESEIDEHPLSELPANVQPIDAYSSPEQWIEGDDTSMDLACYFETVEPVFNFDEPQIYGNPESQIDAYTLSEFPANDQQIDDCYLPEQQIQGDGLSMDLGCYFETLEPVFNIDDLLVDFEPNGGYMVLDGGGDMLDFNVH